MLCIPLMSDTITYFALIIITDNISFMIFVFKITSNLNIVPPYVTFDG
jgi:hypothetical protein